MLSATIKGTHCINQGHNIVLVLDIVTVAKTFTRNEKVGTFLIEHFTLEIKWKYNILNSCDLKRLSDLCILHTDLKFVTLKL